MLYKNKEINCTEVELKEFINSVKITKQVCTFLQPYSSKRIINQTGNSKAVYYLLQVGERVYLQPHVPYVLGIKPITMDIVDEVIDHHADTLLDTLIFEKFA